MASKDNNDNKESPIVANYERRRIISEPTENSVSINVSASEEPNDVNDDTAPEIQKPPVKTEKPLSEFAKPKRHRKRLIITIVCSLVLIVLVCIGVLLLIFKHDSATLQNPVPAKLFDSVDYTVYYPTNLPDGYKIDKQSFSSPQSGVIVFYLINSEGQKIYISQEARPTTFNFGGYYNNFKDKSETVTDNGTIAVGKINNGSTEIASLATEKTWIIANTASKTPLNQLRDMLNSLLVNH